MRNLFANDLRSVADFAQLSENSRAPPETPPQIRTQTSHDAARDPSETVAPQRGTEKTHATSPGVGRRDSSMTHAARNRWSRRRGVLSPQPFPGRPPGAFALGCTFRSPPSSENTRARPEPGSASPRSGPLGTRHRTSAGTRSVGRDKVRYERHRLHWGESTVLFESRKERFPKSALKDAFSRRAHPLPPLTGGFSCP